METKKFIIYGAGKKGRAYLQFLHRYGLDNLIYCFCDKNASDIGDIDSIPVVEYLKVVDMKLPFIVAVRSEMAKEVTDILDRDGHKYYEGLDQLIVDELHLMSRSDYEREICAISHVNTMDEYFDIAERKESLDFFWSGNSVCHALFCKLDLRNVVELACGRGRHVPHYIVNAEHVTLVDILENNIEFCKKRFRGETKISYVVNNGYDLSDLPTGQYSALFTYDSMVHFELLDIANYLEETYRILEPGGKALFHHSNNDSDYRASYDKGTESRSFMNKNIFAYLSYRAGFEIIDQIVVDWVKPEMDCLTLVEKR